ncbi:Glycogen [starch] synthase [Zancudomyces culisetae]|uniref:Glycogen [starch] synthase n=1 Tax=Zancudomyces culisetae TaxID=1213189 RepID=A0A1R1PG66_ZANCU|nr:Glycogen [starch] synthase [Zancudomyces culisetae]|eukprot:OMH79937.1 Glycogen [starch] synthase [Zancudomyces culisetae]
MRDVQHPLLFECAWEVANKVGGIHTVLKTKVPVTVKEYGSRYYLMGPLNHKSYRVEVEEMDIKNAIIKEAIEDMRRQGIHVVHGRWLIEGAPNVILFDLGSAYYKINEWKKDLWECAGIPTPDSDIEMNDTVLLGYMIQWFLTLVSGKTDKAIVAHFHEWQAGLAAVLIKKKKIDVATIFTTHATLLGRYLCAGNCDFYNNINYFNIDEEAGKRGIYHRYCVERAAAHCADIFTTVSDITAYEAEHLLKRRPDGVLPNGLNVTKFSAMHEFQNLHKKNKMKIHDFVRGHFYGHMNFDLDNTLYFFTAGRYEFINKGIDMYIESLGELNKRLIACNSPVTVVAFIITQAKCRSYTVETLKGQALVKQLKETVSEISKKIGEKIFEHSYRGDVDNMEKIMDNEDIILLKRRILSLKRESLPPIVTHEMEDDARDPVLNKLREVQLFNNSSDRVKVVFHPQFVNDSNPILGMDYENFVRGTNLGVFPSYYEPWGYTPAECTVMGVPSVTTNLSGFGCFIEDSVVKPEDYGIYLVDRRLKSPRESVDQMAEYMFNFCRKTKRQRTNMRNRTERLSDILDWKRMGVEYVKARLCALRSKFPESFGADETEYIVDPTTGKLSRPLSIINTPTETSTPHTPDAFEKEYNGYAEWLKYKTRIGLPADFYFKKGSTAEKEYFDRQAASEELNYFDLSTTSKKKQDSATKKSNKGQSKQTTVNAVLGDSTKEEGNEIVNELGGGKMEQDSQEVARKAQDLEIQSRTTASDVSNDLRSLERKLDRTLYLLVKYNGSKEKDWVFPEFDLGQEKSLFKCLVNNVNTQCGGNLDAWIVGRGPIGHFVEKDKKVFFLKAHLLAGSVQLNKKALSDYVWITKQEIQEHVTGDYWSKVKDMLSSR